MATTVGKCDDHHIEPAAPHASAAAARTHAAATANDEAPHDPHAVLVAHDAHDHATAANDDDAAATTNSIHHDG